MYAQKIEGDAWRGEKLDRSKIDKMSGEVLSRRCKKGFFGSFLGL